MHTHTEHFDEPCGSWLLYINNKGAAHARNYLGCDTHPEQTPDAVPREDRVPTNRQQLGTKGGHAQCKLTECGLTRSSILSSSSGFFFVIRCPKSTHVSGTKSLFCTHMTHVIWRCAGQAAESCNRPMLATLEPRLARGQKLDTYAR